MQNDIRTKKEYPKASKSVLQKAQYEQKKFKCKSLISILKIFENLKKIYFSFEKKQIILKKKTFLVAVSGGLDSLALAALSKFYSQKRAQKFFYAFVNHNLRKNSSNLF